MKKSLLTIITLALVVINIVLSLVIMFVVVPSTKDSNKIIKKVANAIELETEAETDSSEVSIDDCVTFEIDSKMTILLKKGSDGREHYAVINAGLLLNTKNDDYSKYKDSLTEKKLIITQHIQDVVGQYTANELQSNADAVRAACLKDLQTLFDSDFIVKVVFGTTVIQ